MQPPQKRNKDNKKKHKQQKKKKWQLRPRLRQPPRKKHKQPPKLKKQQQLKLRQRQQQPNEKVLKILNPMKKAINKHFIFQDRNFKRIEILKRENLSKSDF
jgi:hypothetical protein